MTWRDVELEEIEIAIMERLVQIGELKEETGEREFLKRILAILRRVTNE